MNLWKSLMEHSFWIVLLFFTLLASYFTYENIHFRRSFNKDSGTLQIASGAVVTVTQIIDGDEISVRQDSGQQFIVRLLGIKSFDPSVNDTLVQNIAQSSFQFLKNQAHDQKVRIIFSSLAYDTKKRLLAYVFLGEQDLGLAMVKKGLALVYEQFPFEKMEEYLLEEHKAKIQRSGIWGIPRAVERSLKLKVLWQREAQKQKSDQGR